MSRATFYTLAREEFDVSRGQSYLFVRKPEAGKPVTHALPVERWCDADGREELMAIDKSVWALLDRLFAPERRQCADEIQQLEREVQVAVWRLQGFINLPWYRRVWHALRGAL